MRITSTDQQSWIEIDFHRDENSGHESVSAEASINNGKFYGRNNHIYFLNLDEFAASLDAFVTDRSLSPRLEATYDSFICISGKANQVFLEFTIGDAFCGYPKTVQFRISGAFEFEQECLLTLVKDFRGFAKDKSSLQRVR